MCTSELFTWKLGKYIDHKEACLQDICFNYFGSGWSPELGSSKHRNELPAFTKYEEFIYQPRHYSSLNY